MIDALVATASSSAVECHSERLPLGKVGTLTTLHQVCCGFVSLIASDAKKGGGHLSPSPFKRIVLARLTYFVRTAISTRWGSDLLCPSFLSRAILVSKLEGNSCWPLSTLSQICERKYCSPYLLKTNRSPALASRDPIVSGAFISAIVFPSRRIASAFPDSFLTL